jgi:hypothetical protein
MKLKQAHRFKQTLPRWASEVPDHPHIAIYTYRFAPSGERSPQCELESSPPAHRSRRRAKLNEVQVCEAKYRLVRSLLFQSPKEISEIVFHLRDLVPHISKHRTSLIQ